ncbi:MAG: hypothetical protein IT285_14345 [Bdellovibrionales bacterium]|nr:hypothetical protein [Bdellovibrionales bacterium]
MSCTFTPDMIHGLRVAGAFEGAFRSAEVLSDEGTLVLRNGLVPRAAALSDWGSVLKRTELLVLSGGLIASVASEHEESAVAHVEGAASADNADCLVVDDLRIATGNHARALVVNMDAGLMPDAGPPPAASSN